MKKMTCKEFKQILADSGMDFDIWGWDGILNAISGWNQKLSEDMSRNGLNAGAESLHKVSDSIYSALKARGYYDDIKKDLKGLAD